MREDRSKGLDGHNPSDKRTEALKVNVLQEYGVDSVSKLPINFDGILMQEDEEYGNKVWDKHFGQLREVLARQKQTYQLAGLVNPFISLQNASMGFAGNDNLHHQEFLVQAEAYRRDFIKMLNDEHAFGGSKTGDWGWKANNDFFKSVPDYEYQPVTLATVLPNYLADLGLLAAWVLFTIILMGIGTKKMQIL
jgi:ABC-2 type transport system permease protein